MHSLPDDVLRFVVAQAGPSVWRFRTCNRRAHDLSMQTPKAFVYGMRTEQKEELFRVCEEQGYMNHMAPKSTGRCHSCHSYHSYLGALRRRVYDATRSCSNWEHQKIVSPREVSAVVIRQLLLRNMPTEEALRRVRIEHAAVVRASERLMGLRKRLLEQLRIESQQHTCERNNLRRQLRDKILLRVLMKRAADRVQTSFPID